MAESGTETHEQQYLKDWLRAAEDALTGYGRPATVWQSVPVERTPGGDFVDLDITQAEEALGRREKRRVSTRQPDRWVFTHHAPLWAWARIASWASAGLAAPRWRQDEYHVGLLDLVDAKDRRLADLAERDQARRARQELTRREQREVAAEAETKAHMTSLAGRSAEKRVTRGVRGYALAALRRLETYGELPVSPKAVIDEMEANVRNAAGEFTRRNGQLEISDAVAQ